MSERFSEPVDAALRAAGWYPGRRISDASLAEMHQGFRAEQGRFGAQLDDSSFAEAVLAEFGGLVIAGEGPGVALSPRPFAIDPALAAHSVETLIDAGRAANSALYPLGVEGLDEAVLAITEQGKVLSIDPVDDWLLGDTIDEALDLLITGRQPRPVSADDLRPPRWVSPPATTSGPTMPGSRLRRPVGAAFHLPRTPLSLHYTWLPPILTSMGIRITIDPHRPGDFQVDDWGGVRCEIHVLDLAQHTVLLLAFDRDDVGDEPLTTTTDFGDVPDELRQLLREIGPTPRELSPLASAFRGACVGLTPDLRVAYLQLQPQDNLLRYVAEQDQKVLSTDVAGMLDDDVALLYVAADGDSAGKAGSTDHRVQLPIDGGHLFVGGETSERG